MNYRAIVWALKELGVRRIVAWSGPGAVSTKLRIGDFALPDDLLDLTHRREKTFFESKGIGILRQSPMFCPQLRKVVSAGLAELGLDAHDGGTYAVTEGPRLETRAEVRMLRAAGASMVGMTLAPEAFLARELEMCYHPVCYITNYAEGVRRGGTLVSVRADDVRADAASAILRNAAGVDIERRRSDYLAEGWGGFDENDPAYSPEQIRDYRSSYLTVPPAV